MNADAIARSYESLEHLCFGKALERRRFAFLGEAQDSRHALVCGEGDGRFLAKLLQANPRVEVDFVDASPRMTLLAQRRIAEMGRGAAKRVRFHAKDIRGFVPGCASYDLIAIHFFLDCFSEQEIAGVIERLSSWASPNARWMISEFQLAAGRFGRFWTASIIRGLYFAFQITTNLQVTRLPNYVKPLRNCGFSRFREESAFGGLLHSSVWRHAIAREDCVEDGAAKDHASDAAISAKAPTACKT